MLHNIILLVKRCYRRIIDTFSSLFLLFTTKSIREGDCYFPEQGERKGKYHIFAEQFMHVLHYGFCNKFYFLYGLDVKGYRNASDYVDYTQFMNKRNKLNYASIVNPVAILRNKSLFGITASSFGFNSPCLIGEIFNGTDLFLFSNKTKVSLIDYFRTTHCDLFIKVIDGECGNEVFHIICDTKTIKQSGKTFLIPEYVARLNINSRYILQERMKKQHPAIEELHPQSINTIRLVTVNNPSDNIPVLFSAVLRVGRGDSEVDNWAAGGLSIGINPETGELGKYGFFKPGFGTKIDIHPDSKIKFEHYKIPFFAEAVKESIRFHTLLNGIHSIGWDIAITQDGPCFIEGNDNWEISLLQVSNHGLRKEFETFFQ